MILFIWALCFIQGVLGQVVVNQPEVKSAQLGQSVSIDCKVNTVVYRKPDGTVSKGDYYISWYLQRAEGPPKLLIYFTTMKPSDTPSRMSCGGSFHSGGNGLDFTLTIDNVHLEDAGVYYCLSYHEINNKAVFTQ
ncbi:immunoglobulin light chain [Triplophysa rosa]|nr:immunoglobulin light chain [Triplophysa rosa]